MTTRTWADQQAEKELTARALDGSPIAWAAHLLNKEHARSVRIVKRLQKQTHLDEFGMDADQFDAYLEALNDVLAALERGRARKG